jgi:hypothetical protein
LGEIFLTGGFLFHCATVDVRKNGVRIFVAIAVYAYTPSSSATVAIERFVRNGKRADEFRPKVLALEQRKLQTVKAF